MNTPASLPPTQPYLIRALHEWCTDNGFTPHLAVKVDASVQVPMEYVQHGEIILNVSYDATSHLRIGNDSVEFQARFGGTPRVIIVPIGRIMAIYARENGQGMAFHVPETTEAPTALTVSSENTESSPPATEAAPAPDTAEATASPAAAPEHTPSTGPGSAKKTSARKSSTTASTAAKSRSRRKASESEAESAPGTLAAVPAGSTGDTQPTSPSAATSAAPASKRPVLKRIK
ncbi:Stringent starvation protein B [Lampropedia hyalina DSM 16112]|jgi:stringent starvation protein B|uniref:Stringent starvation protein B n=1 Tax=Lampropedia hyalina DSM 16112 TaxID=1122156 RepID=A0A1M5DBI3_9BURK|nr:Stringent starvation protein B [Lampropedia hyalina DSM 16112]